MYLTDREIEARLPQLNFQVEPDTPAFSAQDQVQPCSIDLRLGSRFWRTRSKDPISLKQSSLLQVSPRYHWEKIDLKLGETVALKPGDMLLGRTAEKFNMPPDLAGKLEGRSSFGRLGLSVHCTADFINPGWRGHMPLELVNQSKRTIHLVPFIPICQLILVPLSNRPRRIYGEAELSSKYLDDDGGPSYWWRDKRVRALHETLGTHDVALVAEERIMSLLATQDPDVIKRFDEFVSKQPRGKLTNADDFLDGFAKSEDKKSLRKQIRKGVLAGTPSVLIATSLAELVGGTYTRLDFALWILTALSLPLYVWAFKDIGEFFGAREYHKARLKKQ